MNWFRNTLAKNRACVLAILTVSTFTMVGGPDFAYAHQLHQQKEERLQEIAETLGIPVEKLRPDHLTLAETLGKAFGVEPEDPVKKAGMERLQRVLREHEEQLAANPYLPQIEAVKNEHAIYRIEGALQDILQLTDPRGRKALRPQAKRAMMRNLDAAFDEGLELPPLPEGLPAKAQQRHEEMQRDLDRIVAFVRPIVKEAVQEAAADKSGQVNPEKIVRMTQAVDGLLARTQRGPRFADRPLPLRRVEKKAQVRPLRDGDRAPNASAARVDAKTVAIVPSKSGISPEILALAAELDNSPAKIFRFVHDNIDFDAKWGATKGSLGTYWERSGTAWEQAWLLRDLLVAAGVDARFEWGEVEIDTDTLMNLTGVQDPWRAGDLMTTAGVPIVLLTQGSQVIKAQMQHVWVKAFVDYIPNRGLTSGPGDSWIRMDPSIKQFDYAPGIPIYEQVQFSLGEYLLSGTELSPRRAFEDSLWSYIRANNIDCTTLEQLKPRASIAAADFPYLPGTLRAKILETTAESTDMPAALQEQVRVEVRQPSGASLLSWDVSQPDTFGQRLEIDWRGATPDDQATLDSYGGVFDTPPYLVDLVPAVRLGGVDQAVGSALGSAEDVEIVVTTTPPGGVIDVFVHQGYAGEPSVLVTAFGEVPQQLTDLFQAQLNAATQSGDEDAIELATLQMLGTAYFQNLGRDAQDIADWNWHRLLRLVSEGLVVQTGAVSTTAGGAPLTFERAERYVDFPGFVVGLFHARGAAGFVRPTLELAGAQGSYLEGQVFDQVIASEGIAAVSALTRSQREGQNVTRVDSSNVDAVLAAVELSEGIEDQVRQAVSRGQVAWIPESPITVNQWQGAGFVLADPSTGAAGYLISGGYAGGVATDVVREEVEELYSSLGSEPWFQATALAKLFRIYLGIFEPTESQGTGSIKSDPVHMATGNFWQSQADLTLTTYGSFLHWERSYNSRSNYSGPLGYGWTFSYGEHLAPQQDGSIVLREGDGTEHLFELTDGGLYQAPPGKSWELTSDASGFELTSKYGEVKSFSVSGRLLSTRAFDGSEIRLLYDGDGGLEQITSADGDVLVNVTTAGGKITTVRDHAGRQVTYTYSDQDLVEVVDRSGGIWRYDYDDDHNLVAIVDPLGSQTTLSYDQLDRCIRRLDPRGAVERYQFSIGRERSVFQDLGGASTYLEFDDRGRAELEVDSLGNTLSSEWDANNHRVSTTDSRGGVTTWSYDEVGNLLSQTDPVGARVEYTYGTRGEVLTMIDAEGALVENEYDSNSNILSSSQQVGGVLYEESAEYDADGHLIAYSNAAGDTSNVQWDPVLGLRTSVEGPGGELTSFSYDELGRVAEVEAASGERSQFEWNSQDQVVRTVDPGSGERVMSYDSLGRLVTVAGSQGSFEFEYDAVGNPLVFRLPQGREIRMSYDSAGRLIERIAPDGSSTSFVYDSLGRKIATIGPNGATWTFGHCSALGSGGVRSGALTVQGPCAETDPLGNTIERSYDSVGRVLAVAEADGSTTSFTYDLLGRRTSTTNSAGHTRYFEYDERGRLSAVIDGAGARTEYEYGLNDQIVLVRDAEGREWTRSYDPLSRLESESDPLGNTYTYDYDSEGNVTSVINPDGSVVGYDYDGNRLVARTIEGVISDLFDYDDAGRLLSATNSEGTISYQRDSEGRVVRETSELLGRSIDYEYDTSGGLVSVIGPQGQLTMNYDQRGRLVEQTDPVAGTFFFEYDEIGRRTKTVYPNGLTTEYSYDVRSNLSATVVRNGAGQIVDGFGYTYDSRGFVTSKTSMATGLEELFSYDAVDRLSSWSRGSLQESYSYDLVGNRIRLEDEDSTRFYEYDDSDRLVSMQDLAGGEILESSSYQWDANGNLSRKTTGSRIELFAHDSLGRLQSHTLENQTTAFFYDSLDRRSRRVVDGSEDRFLYRRTQGLDQLLAIFDENDDQKSYFVAGSRVDETLAEVSNEISYLHQDGLGSVYALSGTEGSIESRQAYRPFGEVLGGDSPQFGSHFGFAGRSHEAGGLIYNRARYYQPAEGRFLQRDPVAGAPQNPSSLHPYQYAFNNPSNYTDPSGMLPELVEAAIDFFSRSIGTFVMLLSVSSDVLNSYDDLALRHVSAGQRYNAIGSLVQWFGRIVLLIGVAYTIYDTLENPGDLTAQQAWVKIWATIFLNTAAIYFMGLVLINQASKLPRFNFKGYLAGAIFVLLLANVFVTMLITAVVDELIYVLRFKYRVI